MSEEKGVWILAEQKGGELQEVSLELVCEGRNIADKLGDELCALLVGSEVAGLADNLAHHGADKVFLIESPLLVSYNGELYTQALSALVEGQTPRVLLCGATATGNDLASRLAARLRTGLVSNCTILDVSEEGLLSQTSPTWAGKVYSTLVCPTARPQMATLRPGLVEIKRPNTTQGAEVIAIEPQLDPDRVRIKVVGSVRADPKTIALDEAEIIVAGGRGMGGGENFRILEELAEVLGGSVAASRVPVDEGWVPVEKQVGQTGQTVAPKLYIACGISGSIYHTMGMKDSRVIIAINKDRAAPIFKLADVGMIGDLLEVVPAITRRLRETLKEDDAKSADSG